MAKKKKNRINKVGAALAGGAAMTLAGFDIGPDFTSSAEAGIQYVDIVPDKVLSGFVPSMQTYPLGGSPVKVLIFPGPFG